MISALLTTTLTVLAFEATAAELIPREVSWWLDVNESATTDAANAATIAAHRDVFSRVMPYPAGLKLDGRLDEWLDPTNVASIKKWNARLQKIGVPVLPYLFDSTNSTVFHERVENDSAGFIKEAVAIAEQHGFQGWFIDYEDEAPPDTDPNKSEKLSKFLHEFGDALHAMTPPRKLTICVASWSALLSNFTSFAATEGLDAFQLMSTYADPSDYETEIENFFKDARRGDPKGWASKAGVGIGVYYDGHEGNKKEWDQASAQRFMQAVADQGGRLINIFRLLKDGKSDWPRDDFWWPLLESFAAGKQHIGSAPVPAPAPAPTPPPPPGYRCPEKQCRHWCNTKGYWGCGTASEGALTCSCNGCNGCGGTPAPAHPTNVRRSVSWWFEIGAPQSPEVDARNIDALLAHPDAVSRVMPDFDLVKGDKEAPGYPATGCGTMFGDIWPYWHFETEIRAWIEPMRALQKRGVKVLPWAIDMTNSTLFHDKVLRNSTAFIADAVAIAEHYGFDGWHIDYEDEHPSDNFPHRSADLQQFLTEFAEALHARGMELVFDVASWSGLLSDFTSEAASAVDQLQNMSFYGSPSASALADYYAKVRAGDPERWAEKAGVGIGIYYDGTHGYKQEWTPAIARKFIGEVVRQGGRALDIFRLNQDPNEMWPSKATGFWWDMLSQFGRGDPIEWDVES
jgi:hypothetical protein